MVRLHIDPDMKMDLKIAGGSFYCAVPGVAHKSQQFSRLYGIPLLPLPCCSRTNGRNRDRLLPEHGFRSATRLSPAIYFFPTPSDMETTGYPRGRSIPMMSQPSCRVPSVCTLIHPAVFKRDGRRGGIRIFGMGKNFKSPEPSHTPVSAFGIPLVSRGQQTGLYGRWYPYCQSGRNCALSSGRLEDRNRWDPDSAIKFPSFICGKSSLSQV